MDSKKFRAFTISIITILLLTGIYFLVGIFTNSYKGSIECQQSFAKITNEITTYADDYGLLTENFLVKVENLLQNEEYVNAITIQKDKVVFFAYPITSKLLKADVQGNAYIASSSPLQKIYTKNTYLLNGDNLTFSVAYNTILPSQIYNLGLRSFIVIFVCIFITFITIPFIKVKENQKTSKRDDEDFSQKIINYNSNEDLPQDDIQKDFQEDFIEEIPEEYIQIPEEVEIQEVPHVEASFDSEILNEVKAENFEEIQNENYNEVENIIDNPAKFTEKNDPMGLFSAVSGFGWENYFEPRLDSELVRAASSEQDVSLFMIKLPELNKRSEAAEEIYQVILDFFKYRDMIFEYKDDSFAGIHINMNLENAINYAEQLFINLYSIFERYNLASKIGIGISTRSMRLVPGNRLIGEAEQAAEKALEEESMPIVAFKVNHEKYRDYISDEA